MAGSFLFVELANAEFKIDVKIREDSQKVHVFRWLPCRRKFLASSAGTVKSDERNVWMATAIWRVPKCRHQAVPKCRHQADVPPPNLRLDLEVPFRGVARGLRGAVRGRAARALALAGTSLLLLALLAASPEADFYHRHAKFSCGVDMAATIDALSSRARVVQGWLRSLACLR